MQASPDRGDRRTILDRAPRLSLTVAALTAFVLVNAVGVTSIVTARREARLEAELELQREVDVLARSVEARLADLRSDLLFLSHSPALAASLTRVESDDPTTSRWAGLDLEGTLLPFMHAQPGLQALTLAGRGGEVLVRVERRGGYPLLMPAGSAAVTSEGDTTGRFPINAPAPPGSFLRVTLWPDGLLDQIAAERHGTVSLLVRPDPPQDPGGVFAAVAPVRTDGWETPAAWRLSARESESVLVASIDRLSRRFRTAVVLNAAIILFTLLAGWLVLRQSRQAARLDAERLHQEHLRELERRLAHNEKLASLGRMAAGLAHEINNPLEGMSNYLGILESDLRAGDVAGARERLPRVREGLERAAGVLRRVLAYSRPAEPRRLETIDLAAVVRETVEFARGLKDLEGVTIRQDGSAGTTTVRGDAGALGQLVLNLLLNAGQLQGAGGEVDVELRTDRDGTRLRVADKGPGIDPRASRRLFEPFRSDRGSSGLGLSICRDIARAHQGTIEARPRPGGGTIFEVVLPSEAAAASGRPDEAPRTGDEAGDTGLGASA